MDRVFGSDTDVDRYSFIVVDLHHLLLAGLPAHFESYMPSQPVRSPALPNEKASKIPADWAFSSYCVQSPCARLGSESVVSAVRLRGPFLVSRFANYGATHCREQEARKANLIDWLWV